MLLVDHRVGVKPCRDGLPLIVWQVSNICEQGEQAVVGGDWDGLGLTTYARLKFLYVPRTERVYRGFKPSLARDFPPFLY
jgi:hypothetical protein